MTTESNPISEEERRDRFTISRHDNGYYQVSIPEYRCGEVVIATAYDKLERERDALREALEMAEAAMAASTPPRSSRLGNCIT